MAKKKYDTETTETTGTATPPPGSKIHKLPPAGPGMVIMEIPDGTSTCSVDGIEYEIVGGYVEVPAESAVALASHGFTAVE